MSNNDWTNKLRESLADYQEPVNADLWASIAQSLAQQGILPTESSAKKNVRLARKVTIWKWSAAAAAVAMLAVGGSYVYLHQDTPGKLVSFKPDKPVKMEISGKTVEPVKSSESHILRSSSVNKTVGHDGSKLVGSVEPQLTASMDENLVSGDSPANQPVCQVPDTKDEAPTVASVEKEATETKMQSLDDALYGADFASDLKRQTGWNVQLYAENGLFRASSVKLAFPLVAGAYYDSAIPGNVITNAEMTAPYASLLKSVNAKSPKHHAPLSVGVQVGIPLASRLSLSTGVVYMRAASDFAVLSSFNYDTRQVLHYVGVPVGINYEVWGRRRLHTYVMASGEADFNVKNSTTRNDEPVDEVKRDRPQFSAKASVGVQLDVTPQIGVYVEPGAKYYFDNGSSIDNTFKDKKLNFNFQFGLRWNIGK